MNDQCQTSNDEGNLLPFVTGTRGFLGDLTLVIGAWSFIGHWSLVIGFAMNDEIFDVVNESDEVIGQERRSEVHRLGLQHRAVHVLVFNARGEVFLQKRSMK